MSGQLSGLWLPTSPTIPGQLFTSRGGLCPTALAAGATLSSQSPTIQILQKFKFMFLIMGTLVPQFIVKSDGTVIRVDWRRQMASEVNKQRRPAGTVVRGR